MTDPMAARHRSEFLPLAESVKASGRRLEPWEADFLDGVFSRLRNGHTLGPGQQTTLRRMAERPDMANDKPNCKPLEENELLMTVSFVPETDFGNKPSLSTYVAFTGYDNSPGPILRLEPIKGTDHAILAMTDEANKIEVLLDCCNVDSVIDMLEDWKESIK